MKLPQGYKRIGRNWLPRRPMRCGIAKDCVYRELGVCQSPQIANGNGDAACHRMKARDVIEKLEEPCS